MNGRLLLFSNNFASLWYLNEGIMKKAISHIAVDETLRIRKDPGDIAALENSIRKVGLLNPIVIDEKNRLMAGYRRLTACRNLGWQEIEVTVVKSGGDVLRMLDIEIDENLFRKDFTPEEIMSIEKRREEIRHQLRGTPLQRFWRWLKRLFTNPAEEAGRRTPGT
jgi:ParB family transcriptional regulator, chromosome partitioning protein